MHLNHVNYDVTLTLSMRLTSHLSLTMARAHPGGDFSSLERTWTFDEYESFWMYWENFSAICLVDGSLHRMYTAKTESL